MGNLNKRLDGLERAKAFTQAPPVDLEAFLAQLEKDTGRILPRTAEQAAAMGFSCVAAAIADCYGWTTRQLLAEIAQNGEPK